MRFLYPIAHNDDVSAKSILCGSLAWLRHLTLTESVAETTAHHLQVTHAASASGLPALSLLRPVIRSDLRCRVAASRTRMLLNVVR